MTTTLYKRKLKGRSRRTRFTGRKKPKGGKGLELLPCREGDLRPGTHRCVKIELTGEVKQKPLSNAKGITRKEVTKNPEVFKEIRAQGKEHESPGQREISRDTGRVI